MGHRLRLLFQLVGRFFKALWRGIVRIFRGLGQVFSRRAKLGEINRQVRAEERQRHEVFENLGKMVYLLFKRNLVRNADLLAECEKVVEIDARIDALLARSDEVKTTREEPAEPAPRVAATPAEMDFADAAEPVAEPPQLTWERSR